MLYIGAFSIIYDYLIILCLLETRTQIIKGYMVQNSIAY